jgi:hypothetical protein
LVVVLVGRKFAAIMQRAIPLGKPTCQKRPIGSKQAVANQAPIGIFPNLVRLVEFPILFLNCETNWQGKTSKALASGDGPS